MGVNKSKLKKVVLGIGLAMVIIALLVASNIYQRNAPLTGLQVHLNDEEVFSFLQKEDIAQLLEEKNIQVQQFSIKTIDLEALEAIVLTNPWVAKANLYIDKARVLHVDVMQRTPVARFFDRNGSSYYIDSTLHIMPTAIGYAYPTVVFTNVPYFKDSTKMEQVQIEMVHLAKYIAADSFWSKQISQVNVTDKGEFECATLLGNQLVLLGNKENLETKFQNLFAFYQQVSNTIGWDKYSVLDLRFANQVVASPSLGWVPPKPVDTVVILPDEVSASEILATMPEQAMEDAGLITQDTIIPSGARSIPAPTTNNRSTNDSAAQSRTSDSSKNNNRR